MRSESERKAINSVCQGSAADLIKHAMVRIDQSLMHAQAGPIPTVVPGRMLLQIHDELIFEGPEENAEAAKAEVLACMERPFDASLPSLLVDLVVDAKTAKTWYDAK